MAEREAQAGKRQPRGLTLVEMLAVIVIIALLMALLLPAVGSVREAARNAGCANNLKQFGIGMQNYEAAFNAFPPAGTGWNGFTFWSLITNYVDDGAAAAFGSKLHLGHPGKKLGTKNDLPSVVDAETIAVSAQNEAVLITMPQFPFFNCPTRGPRGTRAPNVKHRVNSDYVMVASGTLATPVKPQTFLDALCVTPAFEGKSSCASFSTKAGYGILNIAIGRTRITQEQADFLGSGMAGPGFFTNMIDTYTLVVSDPSAIPENLRIRRPYEGWASRVRIASVPDGLSMTAVLAEKHVAAGELGMSSQSGRRLPATPGSTNFGLDSVGLAGLPAYQDIGHFTRGIAFGPSDGSTPYSGTNVGTPNLGPTVGSWHPGNQVNVLMADGSVRSIGSDIDTMYMMPMLGTRNDTDTRTDGRVLSLP